MDLLERVLFMWKYNCRRQFLTLSASFLIGFLVTLLFSSNDMFWNMAQEVLPAETLAFFTANPVMISVSAGLGFAGLVNVFEIGNMIATYYSGSTFLMILFLIMLPDVAMMIGILGLPVMLIVSLYGWISLRMGVRKGLRVAKITGDDEIVRIYTLHHTLDEKYKALGESTRKTMRTAQFASVLGLVAIACVLFFLNNIWLVMLLLFVCMFAFQWISRFRSTAFQEITKLLYQDCDPEACMSALIYYSKRGKHYKLANRGLAALCLINLDEPSLAQDVLIEFRRANAADLLTYYSLMGSTYYQLSDESGVIRCAEEMSKLRMPRGPMGMVVKNFQYGMLENKLNLMHGELNESKKYFLNVMQSAQFNLQKAECAYFIALISYVQLDYVVAKMYFEKTIKYGGSLYYVDKAYGYLEKIQEKHLIDEPAE